MTLDSEAWEQLNHVKAELAHIIVDVGQEYEAAHEVEILGAINKLACKIVDTIFVDYSNDEQVYSALALLHQIGALINYYSTDVPQDAIDDTKLALIDELELNDDIYQLFGPMFISLFTEITMQFAKKLAEHGNLLREGN